MESLIIKPSYEEACKNFKDRVENIPNEEYITPEFINNHLYNFIMAWKPNKETDITQREKDKKCASVLLGKAINNAQLRNGDQKKQYNEDTEHRLLLNFKEKKITLPSNIKNERENDISILKSWSKSDDERKRAFIRFENKIQTHLPKIYQKILHTYANDITKRLSMQKIIAELQKWSTSWSLLWEEIINKIQ